MSLPAPRILYCHCQYAQVVPKQVKEAVLERLCQSGIAFEAVADLCECAARKDPALQRLAGNSESEPIKIAACFPRAVKWIFHQAGAKLHVEQTEVVNMRTQSADEIVELLLDREMHPNLPAGKITAPAREEAAESSPASTISNTPTSLSPNSAIA